MTANWEQADSDMSTSKCMEPLQKYCTGRTKRTFQPIGLFHTGVRKGLSEKNQPLCDIKGRVVMSNIQALEESMK